MHHLLLREEKANHVGIVNVALRLKDIVEKWAEFVRRLALHRYGKAPDIRLSGHIGSTFPYIALPLGNLYRNCKGQVFVKSSYLSGVLRTD